MANGKWATEASRNATIINPPYGSGYGATTQQPQARDTPQKTRPWRFRRMRWSKVLRPLQPKEDIVPKEFARTR